MSISQRPAPRANPGSIDELYISKVNWHFLEQTVSGDKMVCHRDVTEIELRFGVCLAEKDHVDDVRHATALMPSGIGSRVFSIRGPQRQPGISRASMET